MAEKKVKSNEKSNEQKQVQKRYQKELTLYQKQIKNHQKPRGGGKAA
jgi:hypothetical protein